ncbi:hypothetical protein B1806_11060 [Metallibacterium scheffleri]|uniref:Uncharacterized protein n=1 Tax=Metallibacterium scheffleri TaxID=993689 RepID=A0A4S3KKW0_9GAMM|nr:hypothetical protein B1806_11060 [Metallibacterium scheffleri]
MKDRDTARSQVVFLHDLGVAAQAGFIEPLAPVYIEVIEPVDDAAVDALGDCGGDQAVALKCHCRNRGLRNLRNLRIARRGLGLLCCGCLRMFADVG